jgi:Zn-dependent metalloprotease
MNKPEPKRIASPWRIAGLNAALIAGLLIGLALNPPAASTPQLQLTAVAPTANPINAQTPQQAFQALQTRAGTPLTVQWDAHTGTPEWVSAGDPSKRLPYTPSAAERGNPVAIARGFLDENRALFNMASAGDELKLLRVEPDKQLNFSHIRMAQTYKGLNVFGRQLMVHLDPQERVVAVNGQFVPGINVDTKATVSQTDAEQMALDEVRNNQLTLAEAKRATIDLRRPRTELMVYADAAGQTTLAWRVKLVTTSPLGEWDVFVNARKPRIVHVIQFAHPVMRRRTYSARNSTNIPGRLVIDEGDRSRDPIAQAAHDGAKKVYDYYFNTFKRDSIDGQGMPLVSTVNYGSDPEDAENAAWIGEAQQMIYGDGGQIFKPLPYGLDVVGHEFTHGVIGSTADLVYEGQSGALNESFADVFGALIDRGNWTIGETVIKSPPYPVKMLRSLEDPTLGGNYDPRDPLGGVGQPANMKVYANLPNSRRADNGGVHVNSGVPNHVAFLIAKAIGPEKLEQIYYRALTQYMTPRTNFLNAANAILRAAGDLYGNDPNAQAAVRNSHTSVGLNMGGSTSVPTPQPQNPNDIPAPKPGPVQQPTLPAGCTNLIQDGGFESDGNWVQESKGAIIDTEAPHTGKRSAWLGGTDQETTQIIYQAVRIPANTTTLELNYYRFIHEEGTGGVLGGLFGSSDATFSTLIANDRGDLLGAVEQVPSTEGDDTWKQMRFDVSELAGKSIRLMFASENQRGNISSFFVDDVQMVACTTGSGPAAPQTSSADQLFVQGKITDADTGRGVSGAQVFVLKAGLRARDAAADDNVTADEVASQGVTDQSGFYQIDKSVKRGQNYSVIIIARGYRPIVADDGIKLPANATNPFPIDATMRKSR